MPKIFTARQIKDWDAATIQEEPIASINLMERACRGFVEWYIERFDASKSIGIVCGTGNNGGDGLGVARLLHGWNYKVKVWIVRGSVAETVDFKKNLQQLPSKIESVEITSVDEAVDFGKVHVLIDAIFGAGLSRPAEGVYANAIKSINDSGAVCVAIDMPSGLMADSPSGGAIVQADYTVTFQSPKLSFFFPENSEYVGQWSVVDIGLSKKFERDQVTSYHYLTPKSVRKIVRKRAKFAHKGNFGSALLAAGSYGKMGACILALRSALRAGIGLLTAHIPRCGYEIVQTSVPEAMASVDAQEEFVSSIPSTAKYDVVGVGPGLGRYPETVKAITQIFNTGKPVVVDADALNCMSEHRELFHLLPSGSILTPHPKEFERLAGPSATSFERLDKQRKMASELQSVILVKGAHTTIVTPDGAVYFNTTGNPGMATGGSGDVLTGLLTGLRAQGYTAAEAAILGVYLHGLAGDLAIREKGMNSLIASDLIDFLPAAFLKLTASSGS